MHQEKINGEATTERPRTEFETAMFNVEKQRLMDAAKSLEAKLNLEQARIAPIPPIVLTEEQAKAAGIKPTTPADQLGRLAWTLECLTRDIGALQNHLSTTEQNRHLAWAVRHLEDAQNQIELARTQNAAGSC